MLTLNPSIEQHLALLTLSPLRRELQQQKFSALVEGKLDWQLFSELITRNRLQALFLFHIERFKLREYVPADLLKSCERRLKINREMHRNLMLDAARLNSLMDGTPSIVFKGARMATTLYTDPGLREMDDIDIIVPPEKRQLAAKCMNEMGYLASSVKKDLGLVPLSADFVEREDHSFYELVHRHRALYLESLDQQIGIIGMDVHSDVLERGGLGKLLWENTVHFEYGDNSLCGLNNTLEFIIIAHRLYNMTMYFKRPYRLNLLGDLWWLADLQIDKINWQLMSAIAHEKRLYPEIFYPLYHLRHLGACKIPEDVLIELSPFDKYQLESNLRTTRFIDLGDFLPKALHLPRMVEIESFV